jgi:hypothetical protein
MLRFDRKHWHIESGKPCLHANVFAQTLWERDIPKRVTDADGRWPTTEHELEAAP